MAAGQAVITFDYALTTGGAFTGSPLAVTCERTRTYLQHDISFKERKQSGKIDQIIWSYIRMEIQTTDKQFNSGRGVVNAATANANRLFMQKWIGAPVKRIAWTNTSDFTTAGGFSEFNSTTNTNYVNVIEWEPDFTPSDLTNTLGNPAFLRFRLVVQTKSPYTIT